MWQNQISHFPWNARNARAPSILIWTTMWTGRKDCSYDHGWFTVHLCVESLKISMIGGTGAVRCLLTLTFLVTFVRRKNHQPHPHSCACLVPLDVSDEDLHTCSLCERRSVSGGTRNSVTFYLGCFLLYFTRWNHFIFWYWLISYSNHELNLIFSDVLFGQYQQFYAWQTVDDCFGQTA
jgi:hypothetical protein